jgi:hypothetical protein
VIPAAVTELVTSCAKAIAAYFGWRARVDSTPAEKVQQQVGKDGATVAEQIKGWVKENK